jgi:hypothetical protein
MPRGIDDEMRQLAGIYQNLVDQPSLALAGAAK